MDRFTVLIGAFFVSLVGGALAATAGGGGLLVTPALLGLGISPPVALGSRRFAALGAQVAGLLQFRNRHELNFHLSCYLMVYSILGAVLGFVAVNVLDSKTLRRAVGCCILLALPTIIFEIKELSTTISKLRHSYGKVLGPAMIVLSIAINVIAGGAGATFVSYTLILIYGQKLIDSVGTRILPILAGNIVATILFIYNGNVDYVLSLVMFGAYILGGILGLRYLLSKTEIWLKVILGTVIFVLALNLLVR